MKLLQEYGFGEWICDHSPKLNIAIPRPASDSMEIDFSIILGMCTCHLYVIINREQHHVSLTINN